MSTVTESAPAPAVIETPALVEETPGPVTLDATSAEPTPVIVTSDESTTAPPPVPEKIEEPEVKAAEEPTAAIPKEEEKISSPKSPRRSPFAELKNKYFSPKVTEHKEPKSSENEAGKEPIVLAPIAAEQDKENTAISPDTAELPAPVHEEASKDKEPSPKKAKPGFVDKLKALLAPAEKKPKEKAATEATTPTEETAPAVTEAPASTEVPVEAEAPAVEPSPAVEAVAEPEVEAAAESKAEESPVAPVAEPVEQAQPAAAVPAPEVATEKPAEESTAVKFDEKEKKEKPKKEKSPSDLAKLGRRLSARLGALGSPKKEKPNPIVAEDAPKIEGGIDESKLEADPVKSTEVVKAEEPVASAETVPAVIEAPTQPQATATDPIEESKAVAAAA